jgi:hypothetical protein
MQDGELSVSSTTDSAAVVSAVANADEEGGRIPAPKLDVEKLDGSTAASYENPRSERTLLLEQLAQHESDLQALTGPEADSETVITTESEGGRPEEDESRLGIDMAAVRETATRDAIEDARRLHREAYYRETQQQHLSPQQLELNQTLAALQANFGAGLAATGVEQAEIQKLAEARRKEGLDVSESVRDALLSLPGGPAATVHLLRNPAEMRRLAGMSDAVAVAHVGALTAKLNPAARRAVGQAPPPISPVGGSSTKSSLPLDQADYPTYRRIRDQQVKNRYRR